MPKLPVSLLLAATLIVVTWLPSPVRAQAFRHGADYARVNVPDVSQAVAFFRNVLDCERIDTSAGVETSAMMQCQSGMVLELVRARAGQSASMATPLQFVVGDVDHADDWLRKEGAHVIGRPVVAGSGPEAGLTIINFTSPWGLRLQLVGTNGDRITSLP